MIKDTIFKKVLEILAPFFIDLLIEQIPALRSFLTEKAKLTDKKLDDMAVKSFCDFTQEFLENIRESL